LDNARAEARGPLRRRWTAGFPARKTKGFRSTYARDGVDRPPR